MPRFKLVVFDWDGTLVDSTARIVDSMQQAAREQNFTQKVSDAQVQNIIGFICLRPFCVFGQSIAEAEIDALIPVYGYFLLR